MYQDTMYQNKIEYLKRSIKRAYKRYTGERTDDKATIKDVADFFNIPIDETRMEDYIIKSINFQEPNIEICDTKNNTTYSANYTCNAALLNGSGGKIRFNCIKISNALANVDSIYHIGENTPLKRKMTFNRGDYELAFEFENPHEEVCGNKGIKSTVIYSKNVDYEDKKVKENLLKKVFKRHSQEETIINTFEHLVTSGSRYMPTDDIQDNYTYAFKDNVIYGIQEHEERTSKKYIRGICFQNANVGINRYLPYSLHGSCYPILSDENLIAGIIFDGSAEFTESYRDNENLEIYKSGKDGIHIKYYVDRHFRKSEVEHKPVFDQVVPILTEGKLTLDELQSIVELLKSQFIGDEFIAMVLKELQAFAEKIRINEGLVQENLDALSPKLLIDKSFAEIYDEVAPNLDTYFDLAEEQFKQATNISKLEEKGKNKILKFNENSQSSAN